MPISEVHNCDCLEFMRSLPDNYFDLCIADPPYGINAGKMTMGSGKHKFTKGKDWDSKVPSDELFDEIFRVSKNQIIWGGNYFKLPLCKDWIIWDKLNPNLSFAEAELAWCSINRNIRIFKYLSTKLDNGGKIHPTQKPVALYAWLLDNYGKWGVVKYLTHFWGVEAVELQHTRKASISMLANLTKIISKHKKNASEQSVWGRISKRMVV